MQITETLVTAIMYSAMCLEDSARNIQFDPRSHLDNELGDSIRKEIEDRLHKSEVILDWCHLAYKELKK